jgi:hypothetical protein
VVDLRKIISETQAGESRTERLPAFRAPALRPYLPDPRILRTACHACAQGSARIIALTWQWCRTAPHGDRLLRATAPAGVLVLAVYAVRLEGRAAVAGLAAGWLVGAAILAPRDAWRPSAPPQTTPAKDTQAAPKAADRTPLTAEAAAAAVRRVAAAGGWQGAHLDDVLAHLPGHSRKELLDVLAEARVPIAEQLKIRLPGGRQRNRQGVRVRDLPAGLGETPPAPPQDPAAGPPLAVDNTLPDRLTVHPQEAQ